MTEIIQLGENSLLTEVKTPLVDVLIDNNLYYLVSTVEDKLILRKGNSLYCYSWREVAAKESL